MRKKKPVISNTGYFFCSNNNVSNLYNNNVSNLYNNNVSNLYNNDVSNLYNNDVIIYKILKSCENRFVCERVDLIFLSQHRSNS